MADALGVEKFRVLGVSGGGPYALAAAWGLPERIPAVAVVCGAPPLAELATAAHLNPGYRLLLRTYRFGPRALRAAFRAARPLATLSPPQWMRRWLLKTMATPEAEALADEKVFESAFQNYREAWRSGGAGVFDDAEIYAQPWGFPVDDIRTPVRLWHGKEDRNFAWQLSRELAARLPNCESRFVENEAHFSLPIRRRREILADLLASG